MRGRASPEHYFRRMACGVKALTRPKKLVT
jgi:hypothetical protein